VANQTIWLLFTDYTSSVSLRIRKQIGINLKDAAKIIRKEKATGASVVPYEHDPSQEALQIQGDVRSYVPEFLSKNYPIVPETAVTIKEVPEDKKKK